MPEFSADDLLKANLSGTPLENLTVDQIKSLSESGWDKLGITAQDILKVVGDLPKDTQIREIENSMLPQFLKDALLENKQFAVHYHSSHSICSGQMHQRFPVHLLPGLP